MEDINSDGLLDRILENRRERYIIAWVDTKGEYKTLFQYNFGDTNFAFQYPYDVDDDGWKELIVSRKMPDSIYFDVIDDDERLLLQIPGVGGRDTRRGDKIWDGQVAILGNFKDDSTGDDLLVGRVNTAYDLYPRGIRVYSLKARKELWHYDMGPIVNNAALVDVDDDGDIEIVVSSFAPANGSIANGTDDYHSYIICLEHDGVMKWRVRTAGKYSSNQVYILPAWDDEGMRLFAKVSVSGFKEDNPSKYLLLEGSSGEILDSLAVARPSDIRMVLAADSLTKTWSVFCGTNNGYIQRYSIADDEISFVEEKKIASQGSNLWPQRIEHDDNTALFYCDKRANYYLMSLDFKPLAFMKSGLPVALFKLFTYQDYLGRGRAALASSDGRLRVAGIEPAPAPWIRRSVFVLLASLLGLGLVISLRYSRGASTRHDYVELKKLLTITSHGELSCTRKIDGFSKYFSSMAEQERMREGQRKSFALDIEECRDIFHDVLLRVWERTRWWKVSPDIRKRMRASIKEFPGLLDKLETMELTKKSIKDMRPRVEKSVGAFVDYMRIVEEELRERFSVDMPLLVEHVLRAKISSLKSNNIELRLEKQWPEHCRVWGTKSEYRMVIDNLINNAVVAMSSSLNKILTIRLNAKAYRLVMDVEDSGCGISEHHKASLLEEGFTTKQTGGGSGLYQSKMIMDNYGGIINLKSSEVGKGSTFHLEFVKIRERDVLK